MSATRIYKAGAGNFAGNDYTVVSSNSPATGKRGLEIRIANRG